MAKIGIYWLVNLNNNNIYIGSGLFSDRRYNHFRLLERGTHHNWKLLKDYLNRDTYEFIEVETFDTENVDRDMLFLLEQTYIDFYRPYYNIADVQRATPHRAKEWIVEGPDGVENRITNLNAYCRKYNLTSANMLKVARGVISNHKNHRCRYPCDETYRFRPRDAHAGPQKMAQLAAKRYRIVLPDGKTEEIVGLNPFCKSNNLCVRAARKTMKERRSYKGYLITRLYD